MLHESDVRVMIEPDEGMERGRVDERDTMFARMARQPGTAPYAEYYRRRPELRRRDDRIRERPRLGQPGGRYYDPIVGGEAMAWFARIDSVTPDAERVQRWARQMRRARSLTTVVKSMVTALGAATVGCGPVDEPSVYTHKGRLDHDYGEPVRLRHRQAVVFLVEMDWAAMQRAPRAEALRETARQYFRAARIAKTAAAALAAAGHDAKAHYDAHYDVILPALAVQAGLGELGRNNIVIAPRYGSRVRIGAVTTDAQLRLDAPRSLGSLHFCTLCRKCAESCPANALSHGERVMVRGVRRWPTHVERCYAYWRAIGTDCGICMAVCPFSHQDHWLHNLVRGAVRRFHGVHGLALRIDDALYGRRWPSPLGARHR